MRMEKRVLSKQHFNEKIMQKMYSKSQLLNPFIILVNNAKQSLHARNLF